jgi:gamma-glutamylcyclotransferase (GGCT)/AIG2-like uncharacterized protein YtfP
MNYFAYGSNLNRQQMLKRCPYARPAFSASLHHYKLIFSGWSRQWHGGTASIKPLRGEKVLGGIYEVSDSDIRRLDKNEGYPDKYDRIEVIINREMGEPVKAFTYVLKRQLEETKPSTEYLAVIQRGYRDWGLI